MESKEKKVYQIILVVCAIIMGLLACKVDSAIKSSDRTHEIMEARAPMYELGEDVENWILDVVYETDLWDDITPEEKKYLDEMETEWYSRYCIELILLYQKYYGK